MDSVDDSASDILRSSTDAVNRTARTFRILTSLSIRIRHVWTAEFSRGDANLDQVLDVSDAVTMLRFHFSGDVTVRCFDAADANDDSAFDISDAITIFNYLFLGGPAPPPPFPDPGTDPTGDDLLCQP